MSWRAVIVSLLLVAGCEKSRASTPDLSTPEAAARCESGAIRARDVERWKPCGHPDIPGLGAQLDKAAGNFKLEPMPADKSRWGDPHASLPLG
ncbi:MAG: hypothetical protein H6Q90_4988 [Deltaproteobacteria bacterium]|nr:hypothetical protein [Deltaproteobacteria bacterium]